MRRKFCTIGYLPPADKFPTVAFLDNLRKFPTKHPLILFSEDTAYGVLDIPNVHFNLLKKSPEPGQTVLMPNGKPNPRFTNNRVFLTAIGIAHRLGFTHFCYLEADCRVGRAEWDDVVWREFCEYPLPIVIGGSAVCYNPCNSDRHAAKRWKEFMRFSTSEESWRPPIANYGWKSANDNTGACLFVNGALGIYDISEMGRIWNMSKVWDEAASAGAWDQVNGSRLWKIYGAHVFSIVGHLHSILSTYGDVMTTEVERLEWLNDGRIVATHQIKSNT
jgi:hypothetical protein